MKMTAFQLKESLKKNAVVHLLLGFRNRLRNVVLDWKAMGLLRKERSIERTGDKIRVGFLTQYIPAWNKLESVYNRMKEDSRFEVVLICVPSGIQNQVWVDEDKNINNTYQYFIEHGYEALNAWTKQKEWVDLKKLNLDYIFYSRPYNAFMPKPYESGIVSGYTKICNIIYGMILMKETMEVVLNREFYRHVYCYFAECKEVMELNKKRFWLAHHLGLQKTLFYGIPSLTAILEAKDGRSSAWDFSNNSFRLMWTPRWTTKESLGGSNFFRYKDWLLEYAKTNLEVDLLFRPHPLALDNFIKTGEMSVEEVNQYKHACSSISNVRLDEEEEYADSMWNSSVLISDVSGIMPEYFVTGKPLIYCTVEGNITFTELFYKMLEGCYVVHNAKELEECLYKLKIGEDPLAGRRKELIEELFGEALEQSVEFIVEELTKR